MVMNLNTNFSLQYRLPFKLMKLHNFKENLEITKF